MDTWFAPDSHTAPDFVLRSYRPGDGGALSEAVLSSYAHLAPWMPWASRDQGVPESEELVRSCRGRYLLAQDFVLGIFTPDDRTLLGGTGFHLREGPLENGVAEIGMWIRASQAGKGLGTRALQGLADWGFSAWPWQRLVWKCDPANKASVRVAEKAGFQREGLLRGQLPAPPAPKGEPVRRRDTLVFGALRGEWRER